MPPRQGTRAQLTTGLLLACVALLAGCGQDEAPRASAATTVQVIDSWLTSAREEGKASDAQLAILERAKAAGDITRADVDEATAAFLACLDDAGVPYRLQDEEVLPGSGVTVPGVTVPADPNGGTREVDISDACQWTHQIYVVSAYANRPAAIEAQDRIWTSQALRECLAARGYPSDPDATSDEIRQLHDQDVTDHGNDPGFRSCLG